MDSTTTAGRDPWRLLERPWVKWALVFGCWTFFGLFIVSESYIANRLSGREFQAWAASIRILSWAYTWALFTPVILWMRRRFPFEREIWPRNLAIHLGANLVITIIADIVFVGSGQLAGLIPGGLSELVDRSLVALVSFHMDPFIYWVILGLGWAAQHYRASRERQIRASQLETQLAQARLRTLEMQLHPHFLFNALHTLGVLIRTNQSQTALRVVTGLGELLRRSLDRDRGQLIPLRKELEFIESYLEIEQIRFRDRLEIEMEIDPEVQDASVPYLILQPLVENAIRHGIAARTSARRVEIRAVRSDGSVTLEVRDDGPGLPEGWDPDERKGLGLSTTRARLEALYGDQHGFEIRNADGGGALVRVTLPFQTSARAPALPTAAQPA